MSEFSNENRWVLFKEENRKSDSHPEYSGTLNIEGTEYWISAWVKTSKNGKKFFSGTVRPKEAPQRSQSATQRQKPSEPDFNDDIPF